MDTNKFDPTKFGAVPVKSSTNFDPTSFGAVPVQKTGTPETTTPAKPKTNVLEKIGNFLASSEIAVGNDLTAGTRAGMAADSSKLSNDSHFTAMKSLQDHIDTLKATGKDTTHATAALESLRKSSVANNGDISADVPEVKKTNWQGLGDVAGVGLDVLSAGSYGEAAKGAKTGELLAKSEKVVAPVVKKGLGETLVGIGKKTAIRSAVGGGTGYAYDVSQNLQKGKTGASVFKPGLGTVLGTAVPLAVGTFQAGAAVTKETAPRLINSLIKPKQADFSYGKDPGRTVANLGITGNNIEDFGKNISKAKSEIGTQIGDVYKNPANANVKIDASNSLKKIDDAIAEAGKGGKNNQGIVTTLSNIKDALTYDHSVNADGIVEKTGETPRKLTDLTPQEVFDLKQQVSSHTKFNGTPSDDKTVNAVLKTVYGDLKEKLNSSVKINNPEIEDLNQKYADLTSAELATKNRDAIMKRADMISMPIKVGGAAGLITSLGTGVGIAPVLTAIGVGALDKALQSTAVKTRVAAWLGSESPAVITKLIQENPGIKESLYRLLPKLASRLGN